MNTISTAKKSLLNLLGIITLCFSVQAQSDFDTLTEIVSFDIKKQPTELSGRESDITSNPNIISTSELKTLPESAKIIDVQFLFPHLKTKGNSLGSDVIFGFSGAVNADYNYGDYAPEFASNFNFQSLYENASVQISGGKVNLHYYDMVNDNSGAETIFETGKKVASLRIRYTVPKTETTEEIFSVSNEIGIESFQSESNIRLYPNPSQGEVFISMTDEVATATVYDIHGTIILKSQILKGEILDLSHVNPGIYTIMVTTKKSLTTQKIIKL